ncbi:MAG TPA: hypothetical protein VK063_10025 [Beutenbergiaceae bacterium]|nr:hypothetical protein [Beutenbergiaceae bacterium]
MTGVFALAIVAVLVVAWLASSGRMHLSWPPEQQRPEPADRSFSHARAVPGIEWDIHDPEPSARATRDERFDPTRPQEHAHGRHEAQNR